MENSEKLPEQNSTFILKPFLADLPQDIIVHILSLLPVQTLIRFRGVSKSWLNLISNPKFIKTHLEKSSLLHQRLIFSHFDHCCTSYLVKSLSLNFIDTSNVVLLDCPRTDPRDRVLIAGSCDGLVCIAIVEVGLFLWNPSTRISKELPLLGINTPPTHTHAISVSYGFGYDRLNDDYKVVWIETVVCFDNFEVIKEVNVYSIKSDSWRKITDFPYNINFDCRGKYVNEVLHWMVRTNNVSMIISLDLGNETYGEISQPCYGEGNVSFLSLGVLEECLSVFCRFDKPDEKIDIWVMKAYGVIDTWIKLYTISFTGETYHNFPLCISKTREIWLNSKQGLVIYNPTNGSFRYPKIGQFSNYLPDLDAITYVESFVSPNIDNAVPSQQHKSKVL